MDAIDRGRARRRRDVVVMELEHAREVRPLHERAIAAHPLAMDRLGGGVLAGAGLTLGRIGRGRALERGYTGRAKPSRTDRVACSTCDRARSPSAPRRDQMPSQFRRSAGMARGARPMHDDRS